MLNTSINRNLLTRGLVPVSMSNNRGFSLVEILVAITILAFGLLGLASLQANGLRNNHSAYLRSQATLMAYDMADRMRANPVAVNNGDYNSASPAYNGNCLNTTGCTPAQMAQLDKYEWVDSVGKAMPEGEGVVCLDIDPDDPSGKPTGASDPKCSNTGSVYAIKVWWRDDRSDPQKELFVYSFQP